MVTENSVTIICVSSDLAPCVTTPVMRLTVPKSTCSHSCGLLFWSEEGRRDVFVLKNVYKKTKKMKICNIRVVCSLEREGQREHHRPSHGNLGNLATRKMFLAVHLFFHCFQLIWVHMEKSRLTVHVGILFPFYVLYPSFMGILCFNQ